ncbi:hypothetical protein [Flavobacterium sp. N1736]|uniref:hypothetical protein n=1 Tax=Flavobacterium sp. N1736 TaxID=2986823 RepID=UPI0022257E4C|nr:hypothetical protein [Flavobacterium sp. N1736]
MKKIYKIALLIVFIVIIGLIVFNKYLDDKKVHILNEYNSMGKLIGTNEYVIRNGDTIVHGKFINYNGKGVKIAEGQFVNNEPNGKCSYYYDNGKIESVFYRKNSKVNLECTYYNQKGSIEKYIMCDTIGNTAFVIKFDNRVVKKYEGYSILPRGLYKLSNKKQVEIKTGDVLKVGDTIRYYSLVANIPNAKRTFKIENIDIDNSKVKRIIKSKKPAEVIVEEVLTKKGLNRIEVKAQYSFDDKVTPDLNKEVSFEVNVN